MVSTVFSPTTFPFCNIFLYCFTITRFDSSSEVRREDARPYMESGLVVLPGISTLGYCALDQLDQSQLPGFLE